MPQNVLLFLTMTRPTAVLLTALVVVVLGLAVGLALVLQQQHEHNRELSRLAECVTILERNQGTPADVPMRGCPIYN